MSEKNYNLEIIRMLSFFMVIMIHVTNYICRAFPEIQGGEYVFALVLDTVSRVSVPCFFMISGALLLGRNESLQKHMQRLVRFFLALVVWSGIYYFWNVYFMKTPYDIKEILYVPTEPHLWYLYAMIPIYFVLPFLQIMCRGMNQNQEKALLLIVTGAVLFNYIVSLQHGEAYYDLPLIGDRVYTYYVFIGYYLMKYKDKIPVSQKVTGGIFGISILFICILTWKISYSIGEHYERILEYGCPLIVIAAITFFLYMIRCKKLVLGLSDSWKRRIDSCCSCSFGIYFIHILFLDFYKKYVEATAIPTWISVPMLTIGIAGISFICIKMLRKFELGRKVT